MNRLKSALMKSASAAVLTFAYTAQVSKAEVEKQDKKLAVYAGLILDAK